MDMKNKLLETYLNSYPNIEKFYVNNGGKEFVVQLFVDKSKLLKILSKVVNPHIFYECYRVLEPLTSSLVVTGLLLKTLINRCGQTQFITADVDRLYLNYAHLLKNRCKSAGIFDDSHFWFAQPFSGVSIKGLENKSIISVYQVLYIKDFFRAYCYAISAIFYVSFNNPNHYIRRSYTAYEFYLTYFSILRFPVDTELVFANHIDRWAILFDECPQKKKILVQHGIETKTANWPVKLKTVTTLYAFNEELGRDVTKALLTNEPDYKFMKPTIDLVEDKDDKNYKVLIVCHPAAMRDREEFLISHLQQPHITIYAKTHYTTQDLSFYEELKKRYNYHLITTQIFPKVNTLISYRSTLVSEYQICGVPSIMYSDYKSLDDIVEKVKKDAEQYK